MGTRSGGSRVGSGRRPKPRAVCACGAQSTWAKADGPPWRCQRCAGVASRGPRLARLGPRTPQRPCTNNCGEPARPYRRCCSDRCARARSESAGDQQRKSREARLQTQRIRSRRTLAKRRAAFRAIGAPMPPTGRWRQTCERHGYVCWICKGQIDHRLGGTRHRRAPSEDHVIPVGAPGWSDDEWNRRPSHLGCNRARGRKQHHEA